MGIFNKTKLKKMYNEKNTSRIAGDTSSLSRAERDISELSNSRLKSENIYQDKIQQMKLETKEYKNVKI